MNFGINGKLSHWVLFWIVSATLSIQAMIETFHPKAPINLIWINRSLNLDQPYIYPSPNKDDLQRKFLNPTRTQSPLFTAGLESENKKITKSLRIEDSSQQAAGSFNDEHKHLWSKYVDTDKEKSFKDLAHEGKVYELWVPTKIVKLPPASGVYC